MGPAVAGWHEFAMHPPCRHPRPPRGALRWSVSTPRSPRCRRPRSGAGPCSCCDACDAWRSWPPRCGGWGLNKGKNGEVIRGKWMENGRSCPWVFFLLIMDLYFMLVYAHLRWTGASLKYHWGLSTWDDSSWFLTGYKDHRNTHTPIHTHTSIYLSI